MRPSARAARAVGGRSGAPAPTTGRSARISSSRPTRRRSSGFGSSRVARARRRLRRRRLPSPGRRARRRAARARRLRSADRVRAHAPAERRPPRRRNGGPAMGRRQLRPRDRLQLLLLRQRHGRRASRGRTRRQTRRDRRDPGLGRARTLRARGDEAGRSAVPAATTSRRTTRPRPLRARSTSRPSQPGPSLTPESEFDASWAFEYPDAETLGRALVAVAGLAILAGPEREHELRTAIVDGLAAYRRPGGSYRLENEYHYLIARA